MAEPLQETPVVVHHQQQELPPPTLEPPAPPAPPAGSGRNEQLEVEVRQALEGPSSDLGRLCKTLGEAFCLPSFRAPRAAGYDSGSDTTAPADQEHSSSESATGSETGGDVTMAATTSTAAANAVVATGGKYLEDGNVRAVAAAAEVSQLSLLLLLLLLLRALLQFNVWVACCGSSFPTANPNMAVLFAVEQQVCVLRQRLFEKRKTFIFVWPRALHCCYEYEYPGYLAS